MARLPGSPHVGVCSWSLSPRSARDLVRSVQSIGVDSVQLALGPFGPGPSGPANPWPIGATLDTLAANGVHVRSGMMATKGEDYSSLESIRRTGGIAPDEHWPANLATAAETARLARGMGIELVTFHAGFLPEEPSSPRREQIVGRLQELADEFALEGVDLGLETGQEHASTLLAVLEEVGRPNLGVNFDPANMLLYGMDDPVEALAVLAPHVRQIHIKDARRSKVAGEWGEEVRVGTGEVDWPAFFEVLRDRRLGVDLMIEREAGSQRVKDIRAARELVMSELDSIGVVQS